GGHQASAGDRQTTRPERPGWPRKQSRVCSMRQRPPSGRYCLGRSACMREPTPAAGMTTQKDGKVSVIAAQLEQGFAFLDHAQLMPGTFRSEEHTSELQSREK